MANCPTPNPTATIFTTVTETSDSVSTSTSIETSTITTESTSVTTSCLVPETSAGAAEGACATSTVITTTLEVILTTTIPHTVLDTAQVIQTITRPIETRFAPCPTPNPPNPPNDPEEPQDPDPGNGGDDQNNNDGGQEEGGGGVTKPPETKFVTYTVTDSDGRTFASRSELPSQSSLNGGSDRHDGGPSGVMIGAIIGGVVGLMAVVGAIWFIMWRKKQAKWDDIYDDMDDHPPRQENKSRLPGAGLIGAAGLMGGRFGKQKRFDLGDDDSSVQPQPYQYGIVGSQGGRQSPMPLASVSHSHSQSFSHQSSLDGLSGIHSSYSNHGRSTSHTPLMAAVGPVPMNHHQIPPVPPLPQQPLQRSGTPVWASHVAQQPGYFGPPPQGLRSTTPFSSEPGLTPTSTISYNSHSQLMSAASGSSGPPPTSAMARTVSNSSVPARQPTTPAGYPVNEYHKPPLEQSLQSATRPLPPHQSAPTSPPQPANQSVLDVSIGGAAFEADMLAAIALSGPSSGASGSGARAKSEKSEKSKAGITLVSSPPTSPVAAAASGQLSPIRVAQDGGRVRGDAPPPAYTQ